MNDMILKKHKDYVWGKYGKRSTRLVYTDHPRVFLRDIGKPLDQITKEDVNKWVQQKYDTNKNNGNVLRFWIVRQFLKWAKRKDLEKVIPKLSPQDAGKQSLNEENLGQLLSTVETLTPLHRLVIYLEIDSIRRPNEIRKIKTSDRYGNKLTYNGKTGPKDCELSPRCMKAWDEYLIIRPMPATNEDNKFLILNDHVKYRGQRLQSANMITRVVRECCMFAKIEIPKGENPSNYLIKRTGISWMLASGIDPKFVQYQAGHKHLKQTMDYNRLPDEVKQRNISLWENKSNSIKDKLRSDNNKSF
jgi:integrase